MNKLEIQALMGITGFQPKYKSSQDVDMFDINVICSWKKADNCWLTCRTIVSLAIWSNNQALKERAIGWIGQHADSKTLQGAALYEASRSLVARNLANKNLPVSIPRFSELKGITMVSAMKRTKAQGWFTSPPSDEPEVLGACTRLAVTPDPEALDHVLADLLDVLPQLSDDFVRECLEHGKTKTIAKLIERFDAVKTLLLRIAAKYHYAHVDNGSIDRCDWTLLSILMDKTNELSEEDCQVLMSLPNRGVIATLVLPWVIGRLPKGKLPAGIAAHFLGTYQSRLTNAEHLGFLNACYAQIASLPWKTKKDLVLSIATLSLDRDGKAEKANLVDLPRLLNESDQAEFSKLASRLARSGQASPMLVRDYAESISRQRLADIQSWLRSCEMLSSWIFKKQSTDLTEQGQALFDVIQDVVIPHRLSVGKAVVNRDLLVKILDMPYSPKLEDVGRLDSLSSDYNDPHRDRHYEADSYTHGQRHLFWKLWNQESWRGLIWQMLAKPKKGKVFKALLPWVVASCVKDQAQLNEKLLPIVKDDERVVQWLMDHALEAPKSWRCKVKAAVLLSTFSFLTRSRGSHKMVNEEDAKTLWCALCDTGHLAERVGAPTIIEVIGRKQTCELVLAQTRKGWLGSAGSYAHLFDRQGCKRMREALLQMASTPEGNWRNETYVEWVKALDLHQEQPFRRVLQEILTKEGSYSSAVPRILELIK